MDKRAFFCMMVFKNLHKNLLSQNTLRDSLFISIVVVLLTLPFVNKAVHVDDIYVLAAKDHILTHPFDPYGFDFDFAQGYTDFASHYSGSPLLSYYLALISLFVGTSIPLLHISLIIFPLIAALSLYFLSKKYVRNPIWPPLLMIATPTFLLMSHSFMQDVPIAALSLLSIALFVYGIDGNKTSIVIAGLIAAGIAPLFKYTALLLLPLFAFYLILSKKYRLIPLLIIPILILLCWLIPSAFLYGDVHLIDIFSFYETGKLAESSHSIILIITLIISQLSHMGGASIFPFFLTLPFLSSKTRKIAFAASLLLPLPFLAFLRQFSKTFISGQYAPSELLLLGIFISTTLFFLYILFEVFILKTGFWKSPYFFIICWFFLVYAANSLVVGGAARYNTLLIPPLVILYCVLIESSFTGTFQKKILASAIIITGIIGIGVAIADYKLADSYREVAGKAPQYKQQDNNVWFIGHQGFAYYMKENGFLMLPANSDIPKKGDVIIRAQTPSPRPMNPKLIERTISSTFTIGSNFPIRSENPQSHAGFYTYGSGFLPYSFSTGPLEYFDVYWVVR